MPVMEAIKQITLGIHPNSIADTNVTEGGAIFTNFTKGKQRTYRYPAEKLVGL